MAQACQTEYERALTTRLARSMNSGGRLFLKRCFIPVSMLVFAGCGYSPDHRTLTAGSFQPVTGRDLRVVTGQWSMCRPILRCFTAEGVSTLS